MSVDSVYGQLDDLPSPGVEPRPPLGCQTLTPVTAWWAARKRYRSLSVTPTYARTTVIVHPRVPDEHNSWAAPAMLFDLLGSLQVISPYGPYAGQGEHVDRGRWRLIPAWALSGHCSAWSAL